MSPITMTTHILERMTVLTPCCDPTVLQRCRDEMLVQLLMLEPDDLKAVWEEFL